MDKPRKKSRGEPPPLTFGDLFGEAIKKDREEKARRAELDAMGFKPLSIDK